MSFVAASRRASEPSARAAAVVDSAAVGAAAAELTRSSARVTGCIVVYPRRRVRERNRRGLVHGAHAVVALQRRGLGGREVEDQSRNGRQVRDGERIWVVFCERAVVFFIGEMDDVFASLRVRAAGER